ncbi:hypothetical protein ZEAMMB73_Zm00001d009041 [Zea mays]|uniref:Uncharacterized protein n=1 Tax=Zea mays TaxID=4577 RepID=A0A1D6FHJ5_MAIZE|nr:hypothetical protein ZEAMMB73_Zm00001d009041 [Zea mays]
MTMVVGIDDSEHNFYTLKWAHYSTSSRRPSCNTTALLSSPPSPLSPPLFALPAQVYASDGGHVVSTFAYEEGQPGQGRVQAEQGEHAEQAA